jgi:glycosyltransferase involved in cell wall biosynthesis
MFECLGCGKPFIGTKVGGVPEIIVSDDYGLLVEPANSEKLAETILLALDKTWDTTKIQSIFCAIHVAEIGKNIVDIYKTLL